MFWQQGGKGDRELLHPCHWEESQQMISTKGQLECVGKCNSDTQENSRSVFESQFQEHAFGEQTALHCSSPTKWNEFSFVCTSPQPSLHCQIMCLHQSNCLSGRLILPEGATLLPHQVMLCWNDDVMGGNKKHVPHKDCNGVPQRSKEFCGTGGTSMTQGIRPT